VALGRLSRPPSSANRLAPSITVSPIASTEAALPSAVNVGAGCQTEPARDGCSAGDYQRANTRLQSRSPWMTMSSGAPGRGRASPPLARTKSFSPRLPVDSVALPICRFSVD